MVKSAWEIAADMIDPPDDDWEPLPHQFPPIGDWFVWLLLGGRGAGKTASAARYVHEHVHGPPCLPGVPGGHWIGIVAPTLGDGVTSCCYGPSGLRAHDPGLKVVQGVGGATVKWSNGTEAKLFGAHQPEDVERFRSGGNRCIVGGSMVLTDKGDVPIELVVPGDRVLTRKGWRRVTHTWDNGIRKTISMHLNSGRTLTCTPDHSVFVDGTWVEAQSVSSGARMTPCPDGTQVNTSRFGKRRTARSRQATTSTTSTATTKTTDSRISSVSHTSSTGPSTMNNVAQIGTARAARRPSPSDVSCHPSNAANSATMSSRLSGQHASAEMPVETFGSVSTLSRARSTSDTNAGTADRSSSEEAADLQGSVVLIAATEGPEARVYDLTVEGEHEFFCEGVLVHNCLVWGEELAAWRYMDEAWEQIRYGLRVGPRPHAVVSTTPKNRKLIKKLIADPTTAITKATTADNPHLDDGVKKRLYEDYGGTRMGRQELYAEILEDIEGALWTGDMIDLHRITLKQLPRQLDLIVVGVDPAAKDTDNSDETGIIVVGMARRFQELDFHDNRSHGFVLGDYTIKGKPEVWAKQVLSAYDDWGANRVVVEINNGGDMVTHTLRTYRAALPVKTEHASRGKTQRAEPVSTLYEQGRMHHVGIFPHLEDQMTTFDAMEPDPSWSPDRMDALVWGATNALVSPSMLGRSTVQDNRLKKRR